MSNIYVVDITLDENRIDRFVLVADTAAEAEKQAMSINGMDFDPDAVVAGRLGEYNPGITGANMSQGSAIAVQRIGQR